MAHYTRPVNTELELVIAYPANGDTVLHLKGCAHTLRSTMREVRAFDYADANQYNDDWYAVAPCAAKGKGRVCTSYGADCNC